MARGKPVGKFTIGVKSDRRDGERIKWFKTELLNSHSDRYQVARQLIIQPQTAVLSASKNDTRNGLRLEPASVI